MDMEGFPQNHPMRRAVFPRRPLKGPLRVPCQLLNLADRRGAAVSPIRRKDRRLEAILEADLIERRSKVRFPLELRVHFRTLGPRQRGRLCSKYQQRRSIGRLTTRDQRGNPMTRTEVFRMIERRDVGGPAPPLFNVLHTFRATGITAYLENGGTIENAQAIRGA